MKKINYYSFFICLLTTVLFSSCKKDNEVQPADGTEMIGSYNYVSKVYQVNSNGTLTYAGSNYDDEGVIVARKNTADSSIIDFVKGSDLAFQGKNFQKSSSGMTFEIPQMTVNESGYSLTYEGYNGVKIGSSKYHAMYEFASKKATAYIRIKGTDTVVAFEAVKF